VSLCLCLASIVGLTPSCEPLQAVSSPYLAIVSRGAAITAASRGCNLLLLLGGLLCQLPVSRSKGGVPCGNALVVLRQLLAVILHLEVALPRQVAIGGSVLDVEMD
jgi:hypothetical protein